MESRQERAEDSRGPGSQPPLQRTSRMSTKAWTYRSQQRMAGPSGAFPVPLRPGPSSFRGKEGTALTEWLSTQSPSTQAHPTLPASHNPGDPGSCWWVFPLQSSLHELAILIFPKHLAHSHTHAHTHSVSKPFNSGPGRLPFPQGPREALTRTAALGPQTSLCSARVSVLRRRKPRLRERKPFPKAPHSCSVAPLPRPVSQEGIQVSVSALSPSASPGPTGQAQTSSSGLCSEPLPNVAIHSHTLGCSPSFPNTPPWPTQAPLGTPLLPRSQFPR